MFNLLLGSGADKSMRASRMFEFTADDVRTYIAPHGVVDCIKLSSIPSLFIPDLHDGNSEHSAQIGHVEGLTMIGSEWQYRFMPNAEILPIPATELLRVATDLHIQKWELERKHWAVKQVDPYRVLQGVRSSQTDPKGSPFPSRLPVDRNLLAVMMPLRPEFEEIYGQLSEAADEVGMKCQRADDIWLNAHVMDDIFDLIWRAHIVVADFTGKSANVFYETGICHAIGRHLIPITQSTHDIPFDLRSVRTLHYLNTASGREKLKRDVAARLKTIRERG